VSVIGEEQANVIPCVSMQKITANNGRIPKSVAKQVRKRGVLIVRGVLTKSEAQHKLEDLREYMKRNGEDPDNAKCTFYDIFWSKPQVPSRK